MRVSFQNINNKNVRFVVQLIIIYMHSSEYRYINCFNLLLINYCLSYITFAYIIVCWNYFVNGWLLRDVTFYVLFAIIHVNGLFLYYMV